MIELRNDRLFVTAPMVMANTNALLTAGLSAFEKGAFAVDFSGVSEADSSALALMFAWLRHAQLRGHSLQFQQLPEGLLALADLYDVTDLLPLA